MIIEDEYQKVDIWKTNPNVINVQGQNTDINRPDYVEEKLIPIIKAKFGGNSITKQRMIEEKKSEIRKLRNELDEIEVSLLAETGGYTINFFRHDEVPF